MVISAQKHRNPAHLSFKPYVCEAAKMKEEGLQWLVDELQDHRLFWKNTISIKNMEVENV